MWCSSKSPRQRLPNLREIIEQHKNLKAQGLKVASSCRAINKSNHEIKFLFFNFFPSKVFSSNFGKGKLLDGGTQEPICFKRRHYWDNCSARAFD